MGIYEIINDEKYGEALKTIPTLSSNTVMQRTETVSENIRGYLHTRTPSNKKFILQIGGHSVA
jgi:hypothetical protein